MIPMEISSRSPTHTLHKMLPLSSSPHNHLKLNKTTEMYI